MRWRVLSRYCVAAALVVSAGDAAAEEAPPVRLEYVAPDGCPGRAAVLDAIRARTSHLRLATQGEVARELRLRVEGPTSPFHGSLEVSEADGSSMRRELNGPTCDDVVTAMALVAALALDPLASAAPIQRPPAPVPPAPEPPSFPAPDRAVPPDPVAPPSSPLAATPTSRPTSRFPSPPATLSPKPIPSSTPTDSPPTTERRVRFGIGVGAEVLGLAARNVVVAPVGTAELIINSPGVFAPSLRIGFLRAQGESTSIVNNSASLTWLLGRAEACPLRVRVLKTIALRPCLAVDAGELATSTSASQAKNPTRPWVDMSLQGRIEWRALTRLSLDLEGGLLVPLTRNTFVFEPDDTETAYRAPSATGIVSLGATVLFL